MFVPRHQINKIVSNRRRKPKLKFCSVKSEDKGRKPKLKFCSVKTEEQRKETQVEVLFCKKRGRKPKLKFCSVKTRNKGRNKHFIFLEWAPSF